MTNQLDRHPLTSNLLVAHEAEIGFLLVSSQLAMTYLKLTIETLEKDVKYIQN